MLEKLKRMLIDTYPDCAGLPANHIPCGQRQRMITLTGPCEELGQRGKQIVACEWRSDHDGLLSNDAVLSIPIDSVSQGIHTLRFSTLDDQGRWSVERTVKLFVSHQLFRIYDPVTGVA